MEVTAPDSLFGEEENLAYQTKLATPIGRVYINSTQYFEGVPRAVWEYFVGGHQPAQKWLKDRKGEKLSAEELTHYQAIVVTLQRTIELQAKLAKLPLPNDATE